MPGLLTRIVCVLLVVVMLGCSRTEMAYRNADWLLSRWVDGLLDPDTAQGDAWQEIIAQAMQTHQQQLLPDVVRLLEFAETTLADGLDQRDLTCWADSLERVYSAHAEWAIIPASEVLSDVSVTQAEHLAAELRDRNQEYREDYLDADPGRRHQERLQRYTERIAYWIGDPTSAQRQLIDEAVTAMPDLAGDWLAYREERQQALLSLLRSGANRALLQDFLRAWWIDLDGRPGHLVEDAKVLRQATLELVQRLDATLSDVQRAAFTERVSGLRKDFAALRGPVGQSSTTALADHSCAGIGGVRQL